VVRDEENILKLEKFCKGLTPKKHGMTDRNRGRLRQFDDLRNIDALLGLPAKLLRQAQRCDVGGKLELTAIIYALAIELLIAAPVRIKNLTTLQVDRHIVQSRRGAHSVIHLVIAGDEVKNGVSVEFALPKASAELLTLYSADIPPTYQRGAVALAVSQCSRPATPYCQLWPPDLRGDQAPYRPQYPPTSLSAFFGKTDSRRTP